MDLWTGDFVLMEMPLTWIEECCSSQGISSWTPLKHQHSNPNPNLNPLANQLWCIDFLTPPTLLIIPYRLPALLESLMPLKNWCSIHATWSKSSLKHSKRFCGIFSKFKTEILLHIVLLKGPHIQSSFLKFTSCDNQALVGCIPIVTVAVSLNLKSYKMVSHLIRCIEITYCIFKSLQLILIAQSAGAVNYTDCFSAEG